MSIYLYIVAATLIFGAIMPQKGRKRMYYILLMTAIHMFVCAFRYNHLTGDLMKYHYEFNTMALYGWFSEEVLHNGRNAGFYLLMKLINSLTNANFQVLLIIIAVIIQIILAYLIYKYSPAPWMSYLVWNCMSFYVFGFNAIKQSLAMAFVMLSFIGVAEKKPGFFLAMMGLAGAVHVPALVFFPAYWLAQRHVTRGTVLFYLLLGVLVYVFKNQFVNFIRSFYYEDDEVLFFSGEVGNRFIMILGFTLFGILLKGFSNRSFENLFHLIAIAAILQMLAGFDNIFTRLTDYYFQFSILYLPMIFYSDSNARQQPMIMRPVFPFNDRSLHVFGIVVSLFIIWFYCNYSGVVGHADVYRFMWE